MIYILALHGVVTGGPEATHQLSDALIEQGFDARMVYFQWDDLKEGVPGEFPEYAGFAPEYARYKVKLARSIPDEEGSVVVLPETAAHLAPAWRNAKVLVWWLSVDNAFASLAHVNLNYLRAPNVFHASQSRYAEKFVEALQFNSLGMLSDYTVDLTEYADPMPMAERPKVVAFNARSDKVIADLPAIGEEIARLDPEIKCIAVVNMSRPEIAAVFAAARVYVDLGNFPGKDRLPREAASMGCAVVIGAAGAGAALVTEDDPHTLVDDEFLFAKRALTADSVVIASIVAAEAQYYDGGESWSLTDERATFNAEVRDVFSRLEANNG